LGERRSNRPPHLAGGCIPDGARATASRRAPVEGTRSAAFDRRSEPRGCGPRSGVPAARARNGSPCRRNGTRGALTLEGWPAKPRVQGREAGRTFDIGSSCAAQASGDYSAATGP
jgi:hypothetical protein